MQNELGTDDTMSKLCSALRCYSRPLGAEQLKAIVGDACIQLHDAGRYIQFDDTQYARNPVMSTSQVEVLVLCWRPGQISPIHDHAGSTCVVQVLTGTANEITYTRTAKGLLIPLETRSYPTRALIASNDTDTHQLGNINPADSDLVTLHCYSPPLVQMHRFPLSQTVLRPLLS
ncbi:MAG: cysteine dioxygenase family protein [Bdellovibrionota bacterium]|nr:MAG: cysteine dioxygenase family protein [Bdellovibrionota bacterium]